MRQNFQVNPLTEAFKIASTVEARLKASSEEFQNTVKVEIERQLIEISSLRRSVPGEIHTCVTEAVAR